MSDFVIDGLPSVLTKSDKNAPVTPAQEVDAADLNQLSAQDVSLRTAVLAGQYHGLATQASPPVSPSTQVRLASVHDQLYKSENGGAYALAIKPDIVGVNAASGTITPALKQDQILHVNLNGDATIADPVLSGAASTANSGAGTRLAIVFTQDSTGFRQLTFSGTKFKDVSTLMPRQGPNQRTVLYFSEASDGSFTLNSSTAIDTSKAIDIRDFGCVGDNIVSNTQSLQNLLLYFSNMPAWVGSHTYYAGSVVRNGGNAYLSLGSGGTSGVSASSGGPTGTSSSISDGTVTWAWLGYSGFSVSGGRTGSIFVPNGIFNSGPVQYIGSPGIGLKIEGPHGTARGGTQGSCLYYTGPNDGTLLHLRGANGSQMRNIVIHGGNASKNDLWLSEFYNGPTTFDPSFQIGSSGLFLENCYFTSPHAVSTATPVYVGPDNGVTPQLQCSEVRFKNCQFLGNGAGPGLAGCHIDSPGNTKNFTFEQCIFQYVDFGMYQPSGSGTTNVRDCQFANVGWNQDGCGIYMGSGNNLNISSCQIENGTAGFRARAVYVANGVVTTIVGGYLAGTMPTDDLAMILNGPTVLEGFSFEGNSRAGSNVCKVQGGTFGLDIRACDWAWNTTALTNVPVYDGSGNHIIESDAERNNTALPLQITASGCLAGLSGATHSVRLPDARASRPTVIRGGLWRDTGNGVVAGLTIVDEDGRKYITIPYTLFQTAALTKTLTITLNTPHSWIRNVQDRVLVAFVGTAGTLTLEAGVNGTSNAHLLAHDMLTLNAEKGIADADLGASLAIATKAHAKGHYLSANTTIQVKMTSSSGNLSLLSAGSVMLVYDYDYVGN